MWRNALVGVLTLSGSIVPTAGGRAPLSPAARAARPAPPEPAHGPGVTSDSGVRVCAGGDVTLGTNMDTAWLRRATGLVIDSLPIADSVLAPHLASPVALVAQLHPFFAGADIALVNAEGAIGTGAGADAKCLSGRPICFALRSSPAAASALRTLVDTPAVVVANVANNHARDAGATGFATTVALLDSAGVRVTGADTEPTLVASSSADTTAILGFSAWSNPSVEDTATVRRIVARVAARYARVIVTAHLGAEGYGAQRTPDSLERFVGERRGNPVAFAHVAVDAGAGLVIGHGPHVLRAAEWRHDALIFYSLGNLLNYGPFDLREPMDRGAVVCATLDANGRPHAVVLRPTRQPDHGVVRPDVTRRRALALVDSLSGLDFPSTGVAVDRVTGAVTTRPRRVRVPVRHAVSRRRPD